MKKLGSLLSCMLLMFSIVPANAQNRNSTNAMELLNSIVDVVPAIKGNKLVLPEISNNDYKVELAGSSNEAVIDKSGTIYEPLEAMKVKIMYRVVNKTDESDVAFLANNDVELTIPGKYSNEIGDNHRPEVIPGIQEWKGLSGYFSLSKQSRVIVANENLKESGENIAYYFKEMLNHEIAVLVGKKPESGDLYIKNSSRPGLGNEGNYIEISDYITIEANTNLGALYGGTTLTQILQTKGNIPKGYIRDYPAYAIRAQMIDVARFYMPIEYLEEVTKYMAYFKLNQLQVHLNDDGGEQHSSFRVESKKYPIINSGLKPEEVYSQEQYRQYQKNVAKFGVDVISEIDTPAHCRFVGLYDQSLMLDDSHIDLANPQAIDFIKSLYDEFLDGDDPVFISDNFHIGADEYKREAQYADDFLSYVDEMIKYINNKGLHPRMWASLGSGGIQWNKDIDNNVIANYWAYSWADFSKMLEKGYRCINTSTDLYVVPGTSTGYEDYLPLEKLYESWEVNMLGGGTTISSAHPLLEGCQAAIWYDRQVGMSEFDYFDRFKDQMMLVSEKGWFGSRTVKQTSKDFLERIALVASQAPGANPGRYVKSDGEIVVNYDFENVNNNIISDQSGNDYNAKMNNLKIVDGRYQGGLELNGQGSLQLPFSSIGFPYSISMDLWIDERTPENAVLFSSVDGTMYLNYQNTGKIGYERKGYQYLLDYQLDNGRWQNIMLSCDGYGLNLYIDEVFKVRGSYLNDKNTIPESSTFVLPVSDIGQGVIGKLDNLVIKNKYSSYEEMTGMDSLDYRNLALNKPTEVSGLEVEGKNIGADAVDGNLDTRVSFHRENNAWFIVDLEDLYLIDKIEIEYNERPAKYQVYASQDGQKWNQIYEDLNCDGKSKGLDSIVLTNAVEARYIKWQQIEMFTTHTGDQYSGNFTELRVFGYAGIAELNKLYIKANEMIEQTLITVENKNFMKRFVKNVAMYKVTLDTDLMEEKCWMGRQISKQINYLENNKVDVLDVNIKKLEDLLVKEIDRYIFDETTLKEYDELCKNGRYALMDIFADQAKIDAITNKLQTCLDAMLENKVIVSANKESWKDEYALKYMADGNMDTFGWVSSSQELGDYFRFDLRYPIILETISIYNAGGDILEGADIEISMDGSTWKKVGELNGSANERIVIEPVEVKNIRFVITKATSHWTRIDEVIFNELVPVDTSELEALLNESYYEELYTPISYLNYTNAKAIANNALNDPDKTQDSIDQAVIEFQKAIDSLLERANSKELDKLIKTAESKDINGYTELSVKMFKDALDEAKLIIIDLNATQKQIDEAHEKLDEALEGLVPDKTALNILIEDAKTYKISDYTESTYSILQEKIEAAKTVYQDAQATVEQIIKVFDELQVAINNLENIVVNKDKLINLIEQGKLIINERENYIDDSLTGLEELIKEANLINEDENISQIEVDKMVDRLQKVIDQAKLKADISKVTALIAMIKKIDFSLYTQTSKDSLNELLKEAQVLVSRSDLSIDEQNLVDGMAKSLEHVIGELKQLADFSKLNDLIAKAKKIDLSKYTKNSVEALNKILITAKNTVKNNNLSIENQKDVDEISDRLVQAIENLQKITVSNLNPPKPIINDIENNKMAVATGDTKLLFPIEMIGLSIVGLMVLKKKNKNY